MPKKKIEPEIIMLKCNRCQKVWEYHGARVKELGKGYPIYISCPRCRNSNVNLEKHQVTA